MYNLFLHFAVYFHIELGIVLNFLDNSSQKSGKIIFLRQVKIDNSNILFQLGRDLEHRAYHDDSFECVFKGRRDLAQPSYDRHVLPF